MIRRTVVAVTLLLALLLPGCETGPAPEQVADQAALMCERSGYARGTAENFHCAAAIIDRYYQ